MYVESRGSFQCFLQFNFPGIISLPFPFSCFIYCSLHFVMKLDLVSNISVAIGKVCKRRIDVIGPLRKTGQFKYLQLSHEPSLVLVYCGKSLFSNVNTKLRLLSLLHKVLQLPYCPWSQL